MKILLGEYIVIPFFSCEGDIKLVKMEFFLTDYSERYQWPGVVIPVLVTVYPALVSLSH
jgi:hypothetical protein